jgi:hypothetical protein
LLQELFADLDQQYFSGCIGAAGYRVSLQTPGARMYFIGADGRPDLKQYVGEPAGGLCYTDVRQIFIRPRFVYGKLVIRVVLLPRWSTPRSPSAIPWPTTKTRTVIDSRPKWRG